MGDSIDMLSAVGSVNCISISCVAGGLREILVTLFASRYDMILGRTADKRGSVCVRYARQESL